MSGTPLLPSGGRGAGGEGKLAGGAGGEGRRYSSGVMTTVAVMFQRSRLSVSAGATITV